jgi:hypothetical protein
MAMSLILFKSPVLLLDLVVIDEGCSTACNVTTSKRPLLRRPRHEQPMLWGYLRFSLSNATRAFLVSCRIQALGWLRKPRISASASTARAFRNPMTA